MVQQRANRRKVIVVSSDEESETAELPPDSDGVASNAPTKQEVISGKLERVKARQPQKASLSKPDVLSPRSKSKQKTRSSESKTTVQIAKTSGKANGKTLLSFFNTQTQRQTSSQPSLSLEKRTAIEDDLEVIHDDVSDRGDGKVQISKGSSTALALRKRKAYYPQASNSSQALAPPSSSQKFRKTSDGGRVPLFSIINEDKRPWIEQFAPIDLSELAVHKRKVADVSQWLNLALNGRRQRILVMKGAAGSGKTTAIKLLAKHMDCEVLEWRNPATSDISSESFVSASAQFDDFIRSSSRLVGLTLRTSDATDTNEDTTKAVDLGNNATSKRQIVLVEEFPSTFSKTSSALQGFRSTLSQYLVAPQATDRSPTPIVIVISETLLSTSTAAADSFTAHRLLGPELSTNPYVNLIEFNAVAPTILTKALEIIVLKEARKTGRRKTPGAQVLKHLAETGDMRSAVSSLEFLCLRGDVDEDRWSSKITFTKPKKAKAETPLTKAETEVLKLISNRESSLGIFHAVGKLVYNKRLESTPGEPVPQPPSHLPQHRRTKTSEVDTDALIDELGTDTTTFVAALHENYLLSCSASSTEETLDSVNGCIESLSDADLLSLDRFGSGTRVVSASATDTLRQDDMAFQVAVRGLLFCLPSRVQRATPASGRKGDAHKMFYPICLKIWKRKQEIDGILDLLTLRHQSGVTTEGLTSATSGRSDGRAITSGVESWKRCTSDTVSGSDRDGADPGIAPVTPSSSARMEMLLERLPYMAHICDTSVSDGGDATNEDIRAVTSIRGLVPILVEDDDEDAGEEAQATLNAEARTTYRLEADLGKAALSRQKRKTAQDAATEGAGPSFPVESIITRLVLEDDDIVDD